MLNNFVFPSLFISSITFPLFSDSMVCLGWFLSLFKEL
jgi:hypothetical protein